MREIIGQSWASLARNKTRSLLTVLGIVWGLVSVVVLLAYGQGVSRSVAQATIGIGNSVVILWGGQTSMQAGGQRAGRRIRLENEDVEAIRNEVPLVKAVSAESDDSLAYKAGTRVVSVLTKAIEHSYGPMRRLDVESGRYFEETDFIERRRVVIFGPDAAQKVFRGFPPVGQTVAVNGINFEVIGLLKRKLQDSSNNCQDNSCAFIPYPLMRDLNNQRNPDQIVYQPVDPVLHKETILAVRTVLARRHHFDPKDNKAVSEWDTQENNEEMETFSLALQAVLGVIGALTLGVGGVGVMNIMLVSVTERTREIGVRKAVGARRSHLLWQFLTEALVLTFAGGLVGMLLALAISYVVPPMPLYSALFETVNNEGDIFLRPSVLVMAISALVLGLVGVASGLWPAMKAASMDPVEALRYE